MTISVHERQSCHYVTEGRGHSRFFTAVLGQVENHRKVAPEHKSHQPLKVVLKIKKLSLTTRKLRYVFLNKMLIIYKKMFIVIKD